MKNITLRFKFIITCLSLIIFTSIAQSQVINYQKLKVYTVDGKGTIFNEKHETIGKLDIDGNIYNAKDTKIAHIDAYGNIFDNSTDEKYGKVDKNGNLLHVVKKKVVSWKCFAPENDGTTLCLIKNKEGKVVATVNKLFKEYGPGAIYYFKQINKK